MHQHRSYGLARDNTLSTGGLIKDYNGIWLSGFSSFIGTCHILKAELWSIQQGLKLAMDHNITHIIVETDSKIVSPL